jgi:hypothetical protein
MLSYALVSICYLLISTHLLLAFLRVVLQVFGSKLLYLAVAILVRYGEAQLLQHLVVLFVIEKRVSDY